MNEISDNIDEKGLQIEMPCTEKDSPYYEKDYNKLENSEKFVHEMYVQGKSKPYEF